MARIIRIERSRLRRWLDNFAQRHPGADADAADDQVRIRAPDGALAQVQVPFPPLVPTHSIETPAGATLLLERLVHHVNVDRRVGAILVRKGGFAAGVFDGDGLSSSKVGTGYVQSKTKAGGWSQQRYARRRGQQARQLYDRAAAAAQDVLLPEIHDLLAVATGGDRDALTAVTKRPGLAPLRPMIMPQMFPVPDPRQKVLESFPDQFLAVRIELNDQA